MNILEIIDKKRKRQELAYEEIKYAVDTFLDGSTKDYQMSALLMAITINGMKEQETFDLTDIMLKSGEIIDLSDIKGTIVDKHSTGGVGDKTTLILAAVVASCGVKVAKMSGKGLGFTGGTIDKLESIGIKTEMDLQTVIKQVNDIGVAVVGQMKDLVPADKKIYALRDVTGTTESIPLIASSIMSKKLASGADKIVIDLKLGNGAFMKNINDAEELANLMIKIGKKYNKNVICVITDMSNPLGHAIGNSLEVEESIDVLQGKGPEDVKQLVIVLGSYMVSLGKNITLEESKTMVETNLNNGKAFEKFKELVKAQHGNIDNIAKAPKVFSVKSVQSGYITHIDTSKLGEIVAEIGGGRTNKEDKINYQVGIVLSKEKGNFVEKDEEILKIYLDKKDIQIKKILDCFIISNTKPEQTKLIKQIIS